MREGCGRRCPATPLAARSRRPPPPSVHPRLLLRQDATTTRCLLAQRGRVRCLDQREPFRHATLMITRTVQFRDSRASHELLFSLFLGALRPEHGRAEPGRSNVDSEADQRQGRHDRVVAAALASRAAGDWHEGASAAQQLLSATRVRVVSSPREPSRRVVVMFRGGAVEWRGTVCRVACRHCVGACALRSWLLARAPHIPTCAQEGGGGGFDDYGGELTIHSFDFASPSHDGTVVSRCVR